MWQGISCAYRLLLKYELTQAIRFEYLIRLRTDVIYDAGHIQIHDDFNKIHGLMYITNRYLALGGFHNALALMGCDNMHFKHCGQMPDTECLLKRRIEFWGGQLDIKDAHR